MGLVRTCRKWKPRKVCYTRRGKRICKKTCAKYSTHRRR